VVDLDRDEYQQHEVLIHDTAATSPALAALLATLEPPEFPMALGVFRDIDRPTYEELLLNQNRRSVAERGVGRIEELLGAGLTWEVQ
jgi:2-oxoglutarate ferredoxin oxidoreductase subunit beta